MTALRGRRLGVRDLQAKPRGYPADLAVTIGAINKYGREQFPKGQREDWRHRDRAVCSELTLAAAQRSPLTKSGCLAHPRRVSRRQARPEYPIRLARARLLRVSSAQMLMSSACSGTPRHSP